MLTIQAGEYGLSLLYANIAMGVASVILAGYVALVGAGTILRAQALGVAVAALIWAAWFALTPATPSAYARGGGFLAELILLLAWFALLERMLRGPYLQSMPELVRRAVRWVWLVVAVSGAMVAVGEPRLAPYVDVAAILSAGLLILSLLGAVLAAQLYGEATIEPHASLRGFCVAAAVVMGAQGFVHALALLVPDVPFWVLLLRVAAHIFALGVLAWALQSDPQWSLAIFVSPQARVYAPRVLAAVAAMLLIVLAAPLYVASASPVALMTAPLLVGFVGFLLTLVLFSERLRAQLRVFVSKHFLPFRYDYREEWLRLIDTLASPGQEQPLPIRAIKSLAQIVGSPGGLLWLRDGSPAAFTCVEGWNTQMVSAAKIAADDPVIRFMAERQWILDTAELQRQPELYPGISRPAWLAELPDALLVVPLFSNETIIGCVVLIQSSSAFRLTFEEIDLLRTSGRQVAAHLAQYSADRQLAEAKQFEAFNRLTAFVMHDLKNLIAQQSLMVKNAAKHKTNPAFVEDAMATIENSVARMNKLLQQLQHGDTSGPRRLVSLASCVKSALRKCEGRQPVPGFVEPVRAVHAVIEAERFASVLAHLVRNAQDATDATGRVDIELQLVDDRAVITIRDTGSGMDDEFVRNRLFKPFDTTKGSQGMGIGAYQARSFVVAAGGSLTVESVPGQGTLVRIELPAAAAEADTPSPRSRERGVG
ncbi:MAG: XrtA/PEP-CTERM system histidine kinase PrsK [Gammaproteobacteria bacterium]|nr:XrtA/PEP-CTERM system histidine kinase PrsK [Gammaproteobacteria bacterium]